MELNNLIPVYLMKLAPIPHDEEKRLRELLSYAILDSDQDPAFDEITNLAASVCETKISLVSFIDSNRQWFKSRLGLEASETPRDISFCGHAILGDDIFIVEDAALDERFCDNPLFLNEPNVRFYAGVPLVTPTGFRIGTLCVIDTEKKTLDSHQIKILKSLAKQIMHILELRLKNSELKEVSEHYREVQRITKTGGWELDIETHETFWSEEVYEIYQIPKGTPTNKIEGMSYFPVHERERLGKLLDESIANGTGYDSDFEFIDAKGSQKWVRAIGNPIKNASGKVVRLVGTIQDITKQKYSEFELMKRTTELEAYARGVNTSAKVSRTDIDGNIIYVNDLFCVITGYSREEVIGKNQRLLNSGHHPKSFFSKMWETVRSGNVWRGEIKNKNKAGDYFWVDATITPLMDASGNVYQFIAFKYDITERKQFEDMLRESELRYRVLFDQSTLPLMTLEPPHWNFTSANRGALKLFGCKDFSEFCSLPPWVFSPSHQPDGEASDVKAKSFIDKAMEKGEYFFEWTHKNVEGTTFPCTVQLSRIEHGDKLYLQATVTDIREQRAYEKQLKLSNQYLDLALEGASLGIWDWNLTNNNVKFDRRWAEMIGHKLDDIKMELSSWESRVHPDDIAKCYEDIKAYLDGKTSRYENVHRMKHANGSWVYILDRGKFSDWDETGKPIRFTGTHFDITEVKLLEQQLIDAQSISKIGSWSYNLITNEQIWSSEHYRIFEIPEPQPSEILYKLYRERIHPEDLLKLDLLLEKTIKTGEGFTFDHRVVLDNGTRIKYVQGIARVAHDLNGKPAMLSGTCRDRTQNVESEQRYLSLLEAMSEGMVVLDSKGAVSQFNTAALGILGLTEEQLLSRTRPDSEWTAIREDGSRYPFNEHPSLLALKTGKSYFNVKMGLRIDSDVTRWVSLNAIPIEYPEGRKVLSTFSDITELVNAHEENKFLLDSLGIGIWKYNVITKKLDWDHTMYTLYGVTPGHINHNKDNWFNLLSSDSRKEVELMWLKIERGATEFSSTYEIRTKAGEKKYIGVRGQVIRNQNGDVLSLYGINWDITKEVELEKNFQIERAKSMHNAKLASIGQLAAGVGHEINNPLSIISGHVTIADQMLDGDSIEKEKLRERIKKIDAAVFRIANIVRGLRTFARSDDNQIIKFDMQESIQETISLLKEIYEKEQVRLFFHGEKRNALMTGNRGRLQQVVVNLITNAKDATVGKSSRVIDVNLSYTNDLMKISVKDNGSGIPPEIREKIFEPFFTTKDINIGTGLGLSLVSTIVKEHNGKIDLESEPGKGTTFSISLPIEFLSDDVAQRNGNGPQEFHKADCSILIVDDEEELRDILKFILLKFCSNVVAVASVKEALKEMNKQQFKLIISDISMPDINGFKFLDMVRARNDIQHPKFLFITGGVELDSNQQVIVEEKTSGLLIKPFREDAILEKIHEIFEGQYKKQEEKA